MGRTLKGGVWTNVEDEVLKSAIMKYGTNQWARVASLINRKSAAQCKARWYEWLSPTVKKTEWTQDENEKLLHLAKVFPTQWRTISDMIGRTPTQCHQQYVYITEKMNNEKEGLGDLSNLRQPDDISVDIRPESRPAKPDSIDMAEDEIDMLNEARARLANTQGKKAKRKGRERQLILARRLAQVQQTRELNEVGINANKIFFKQNKKPGINYNEEIPFYQPIPRGFYDTSKEKLEIDEKVIGKRVSDLEFESREDREKRHREKDAELKRKREEEDLPSVLKSTTNAGNQIKRSKLVLSEPKLDDEEFQNLLKMGRDRESFLSTEAQTGKSSTNLLISTYISDNEGLVTAEPTPMSASIRQRLEVENLKAIYNTQTPLLGGENVPLHDIKAIEEEMARKNAEAGNSVLRAHLLGTPGTESSFGTPSLSTNKDGLKFNMAHKKHLVQQNLSQLPKPKEQTVLEKPDFAELKLERNRAKANNKRTMDQEDLDKLQEEMRLKNEQEFLAKRSQVIRRNLPRPLEANHTVLRPESQPGDLPLSDLQKADELVKQEMLKLIHYDLWKNPLEIESNGKYCTITKVEKRNLTDKLFIQNRDYSYIDEETANLNLDDLNRANKLLNEEIEIVKQEVQQHLSGPLTIEAYEKVWDECMSQLMYLAKEKRYTRAGLVQKKDRIDYIKNQFELMSKQYAALLEIAQKKENKMNTLLNGYMSRNVLLTKAITDVYDNSDRCRIELNSLEAMQVQEQAAIIRRLDSLQLDVERQKKREVELQQRYAALLKKKDKILNDESIEDFI